ncbi:hypothetical protein SAMN02746041_01438 [Desulfacinum hydrothermale DSM 13146]|uniref:Uncharacterized protein n=1 Tax=Desulfacinum hydrothermale DSM 13146 TaxID=1121390 RepID=A0A1W1XF75_9BACT|nr:hypothetical protein [Desulfacinum hydrothermale]SMC22424.1 hypothetical protein SAMN02746041_01438 [Desulfacinum hydrothermale DSM 13146]
MDAFLDQLWARIVIFIQGLAHLLDAAFGPLHGMGPAATVAVAAGITFGITRVLDRIYRPKRYQELQEEFHYWYGLRQEALACGDPEKAKALAKNIDQAKLNQVYYNYFFEGLLRNIVTSYLPFLSMLAYVNEAYRPERLTALFGRDALFTVPGGRGETVAVGSVFWFVAVYLGCHLIWFLGPRLLKRLRKVHASNSSSAFAESPSVYEV